MPGARYSDSLPTLFPPDVVPAGFALSEWWHISFLASPCSAAGKRSLPGASFSLVAVERPDSRHSRPCQKHFSLHYKLKEINPDTFNTF